jgi:hypothetical protein
MILALLWKKAGYRKGAACERCRSERPHLLVHHKDRDPYNNEFSNLETLCRRCHIREHREEVQAASKTPEVIASVKASVKAIWDSRTDEQRKQIRKNMSDSQTFAERSKHALAYNALYTHERRVEAAHKSWAKRRAKLAQR